MYFLVFLVILVFILFVALVILLNNRLKGNGQQGFSLDVPNCPSCNKQHPAFRIPKSLNQILWGGWTCDFCQTEVDNQGRVLTIQKEVDVKPLHIKPEQINVLEPYDKDGKSPVERIIDDK